MLTFSILFIFSCHDDSSSSSICKLEETEDDSVTTRFYDVAISATDNAGNTGTKICSVIVIPDNHYDVNGTEKSGKIGKSTKVAHNPNDLREEYKLSTKRYVISELSLEWNPNLDTTLVPPPLPEPDINSKAGKGSRNVLCEKRGSKGSKGQENPTLDISKGSEGQGIIDTSAFASFSYYTGNFGTGISYPPLAPLFESNTLKVSREIADH